VSQANLRIAPLARPNLVKRQPELLAHHLTARDRHRRHQPAEDEAERYAAE